MVIDHRFFGPLAMFIGTWEGLKGDDTAPDDFRGVERNSYREQIVFTPMPPTNNHEQTLYALSYSRTAWRLGEEDPFHCQLGYWLWDPTAKQVMHSFMIPRGMTVLAGGDAQSDSTTLLLKAKRGSSTFGILANPFLDDEFTTVGYEAAITIHGARSFSYREDTQIQIKGQSEIFHHVDLNTLEKTT
jgi:hypothetical protein